MDIIGWSEFVFHLFDEHLNDAADDGLFIGFRPFTAIDSSFALEADVDDDEIFRHFDDFSIYDLVDAEVLSFAQVGSNQVVIISSGSSSEIC